MLFPASAAALLFFFTAIAGPPEPPPGEEPPLPALTLPLRGMIPRFRLDVPVCAPVGSFFGEAGGVAFRSAVRGWGVDADLPARPGVIVDEQLQLAILVGFASGEVSFWGAVPQGSLLGTGLLTSIWLLLGLGIHTGCYKL